MHERSATQPVAFSEPLLTVAEVAGHVRMSADGVRRAILRGDVFATRPGREWLIPASSLAAWLEARSAARLLAQRARSPMYEPPAQAARLPAPRTPQRGDGRSVRSRLKSI